jgi:hypothetical protein
MFAAAGVALLGSCLEPTEIMLELTSDACADIASVEVLVGDTTAPVAKTDRCPADGKIGTLALVPSGRDGRAMVHVRAQMKVPNATCSGPTPIGCLAVTRSIAFVPHARLTLPISLDRACLAVSCPSGETCQKGVCVPTAVGTCPNGKCDPLADAGPPPVIEAGVCVPPYVVVPTNERVWHFDESPGSPTTGDSASCGAVPIKSPTAIAPSTLGCGNALDARGALRVGCDADSIASAAAFHVALWFQLMASADGVLVQKIQPMTDFGWAIVTKPNGALWVQAHQGTPTPYVQLQTVLQINRWYRLDVQIAAGLVKAAWLDGNPLALAGPSPTLPSGPMAPVTIGPASAFVDELYFYQ